MVCLLGPYGWSGALEHDILTVFWVLIIYHSWNCDRLFLCDSDLTMNM